MSVMCYPESIVNITVIGGGFILLLICLTVLSYMYTTDQKLAELESENKQLSSVQSIVSKTAAYNQARYADCEMSYDELYDEAQYWYDVTYEVYDAATQIIGDMEAEIEEKCENDQAQLLCPVGEDVAETETVTD